VKKTTLHESNPSGRHALRAFECPDVIFHPQHFAEIEEDQFDFHGYCMRKMTLRAYIGYATEAEITLL
jgi:hypothetical protein